MDQIFWALFQIFNLLLIAVWLLLTIGTILALQRQKLNAGRYLGWAVLIIFIPFLGAAVFWMQRPTPFES